MDKLQSDIIKKEVVHAYIENGTVTAACNVVDISRQTFYRWQKEDEQFASEVARAEAAVADDLEKEAIRRAKDGSDTLLIFLLKGHKPDKFKENRNVELTGKGGGPVTVKFEGVLDEWSK